jgi:hypothetical protein
MPRYRTAAGGWDYWNPYTNESTGLADSYAEARRLALARLDAGKHETMLRT